MNTKRNIIYAEIKSSIGSAQSRIEEVDSERLSTDVMYTVGACAQLGHVCRLIEYLELMETGVFDPGPLPLRPCPIMPECGENLGGGCHLMAGCI